MVNQNLNNHNQSQFTTNKFLSNNLQMNDDGWQKYDDITANPSLHCSQLKLHDLNLKVSNETYLKSNISNSN